MKNINYSVVGKENDGKEAPKDGIKLNSTQKTIVEEIRKNKYCTIEEIALIAGVKTRAVERNLKALKDKGVIERIGGRKNGYWVVNN